MATLRGAGAFKGRNLIASFSESQITRNDKNQMTGAFMDVQIDQHCMTQASAKAGKADSNPHVESHEVEIEGKDGAENRKITSHTVWYSKSQIESMQNAGKSVQQEDGKTAIAFKANLQQVKRDGAKRVIVMTPKDPSRAKNDAEKASIDKYNETNQIKASDFASRFGPKSLSKQEGITAIAKEVAAANRAAKSAQAEQQQQAQAQNEAAAAEASGPEME